MSLLGTVENIFGAAIDGLGQYHQSRTQLESQNIDLQVAERIAEASRYDLLAANLPEDYKTVRTGQNSDGSTMIEPQIIGGVPNTVTIALGAVTAFAAMYFTAKLTGVIK